MHFKTVIYLYHVNYKCNLASGFPYPSLTMIAKSFKETQVHVILCGTMMEAHVIKIHS